MKKSRNNPHLSNEGFSLMELIVTMLVSAVVVAAATGFLVAGVQFYNRANAETVLQTESQVAELFLTELMQEAVDYKYASSCPGDVDGALEVHRKDDAGNTIVSMVVWKDGQLWYSEVDVSLTDDAAKIAAVTSKSKSQAFLADCVTYFTVFPGERPDDINAWDGLVKITASYEELNKSYKSEATVSWRNKKRN